MAIFQKIAIGTFGVPSTT